MNIKPRLTIYIIFCLTILFSSPNKGIWEQYDYNSGISSNYIFDVEKDEQDRIWVSTQNGITLIDGEKTKKYGLSNGLPATNIVKIVSLDDIIYAATSNKGVYFLSEGDTFKKAEFIQGDKVYTMNAVESKLFISTKLENVLYDGNKASFMGNGFPKAKIRDVYVNNGKTVYLADKKVIYKKGNKYVVENIDFESSKAKIKSYYSFNGIEYFGTSKGLWSRSKNEKLKLIKNIDVLSLEHDQSNTLYIGTKKGMYYLKNGKLS